MSNTTRLNKTAQPAAHDEWCTGCNTDHNPDVCGYRPEDSDSALPADKPADQCAYCKAPAHETRTGAKGNTYALCFQCAQDWQAVMVRKEDVPQVKALGRRLYQDAAARAGYTLAGIPAPAAPAGAALDQLTAAQRGEQWMNKWGCPGFCTVEHGTPGGMDIHSTAPVETSLLAADVDSIGYSDGSDRLPWMSAQVLVSNDKSHAYGRTTSVWLGYGVHLAELSPAKAREALDALRAFTIRLAAVVDFAEQVAADDFEGDPEIAAADREAETRRTRAIVEASQDGTR